MKRFITILALMLPALAFAQWRVGANVGATFNHPTIDKQYMVDYQYKDRRGFTFGLMGQYDFNDWLGVRAELDWTQKNYRQTRAYVESRNQDTTNDYLLMPVMASFSFGGNQLRGFCNLGVYGGYWLKSYREGEDYNDFSNKPFSYSEKVEFEKDRDQRWDCGLAGGIGLEYRFLEQWAAQVEARCYYSTTSFRKEQPHVSDMRYHTTLGLQAGVVYFF